MLVCMIIAVGAGEGAMEAGEGCWDFMENPKCSWGSSSCSPGSEIRKFSRDVNDKTL